MAQYNLAKIYYFGDGVKRDVAEAAKWYRKAADQGNAIAQGVLGDIYLQGDGVTRDEAEASTWYRKAADQGNADAQNNMGTMYAKGLGVPHDDAEAVRWYRLAADQGHVVAQSNLGFAYARGQGVPQDYAKAFRWHRKAAEQGNANAQKSLGAMYAMGQGVKQDYTEAVRWSRKAADQGNAEAEQNLANLYAAFPNLRRPSDKPAAPVASSAVPTISARAPAAQTVESAPKIPTQIGWVTVQKHDIQDGFKVFRRYSYMGDADFLNLIMFMCSKDARTVSHLTFVLPKDFQPVSFPRDKWLPQIVVRFLVDNRLTISVPGEYRNGEFYFDMNSEVNEQIVAIMRSKTLAMGFGDKNDIVQFEFADAIDQVFSQFAPKILPGTRLTHYAQVGAGNVVDACLSYQKTALSRVTPGGTPAKQVPADKSNAAAFINEGETYEKDQAWGERIERGACSRFRVGRTDSPADIAECNRDYASRSPCISYKGFATAWYDSADNLADKSLPPDVDMMAFYRGNIDRLGTTMRPDDPPHYRSPQFRAALHRLLNVGFSPERKKWGTRDQFADHAYKICMEGRPF